MTRAANDRRLLLVDAARHHGRARVRLDRPGRIDTRAHAAGEPGERDEAARAVQRVRPCAQGQRLRAGRGDEPCPCVRILPLPARPGRQGSRRLQDTWRERKAVVVIGVGEDVDDDSAWSVGTGATR